MHVCLIKRCLCAHAFPEPIEIWHQTGRDQAEQAQALYQYRETHTIRVDHLLMIWQVLMRGRMWFMSQERYIPELIAAQSQYFDPFSVCSR